MRRVFWIALVASLSGCAQQSHVKLYAGPELPAPQLLVVEVPDTLEIMGINGRNTPAANAGFGTGARTLHLRPGEYRINAYYQNVFDIDGGLSHEVVRTRSAVYRLDGRAGDAWTLEFEPPAGLREARAMEDSFSGWARNVRTGERIATEAGSKPVSAVGHLLGERAPADAQRTVEPLDAAPASAAASLPHSDAALDTLKQLWRLLGPESRAAFLEWARP